VEEAPIGQTLVTMRRLLLAVVLAGVVGTETELLLIGHYEDVTQRIPLGLLFLTFTVLCWHLTKPGPASVTWAQFDKEIGKYVGPAETARLAQYAFIPINPSIRGVALFWKVMRAKAPPALAPAALIGLGVLGLTCIQTSGSVRRRKWIAKTI
jgi:hypothetical protein